MVALARSRCDELWLVIVHDVFSGLPSELTTEAARPNIVVLRRLVWLTRIIPSDRWNSHLFPRLPNERCRDKHFSDAATPQR